jgi:tRNA (guanine37-N1)-methyltransferase
VLLSGNHAEIERWRRRKSIQKTLRRRPDLIRDRSLSEAERREIEDILKEIGE